MAQGAGLGDHPAHGYGETCGGDHQQHGVDLVGGGVVAEALGADDGIQGDLVQGADDLDNGGGHGQHGGTLKEILLLFRHKIAPYLLSSNSLGMA